MNEDENLKIVRTRMCIKTILIFLGVLAVQMTAYILCVFANFIWLMATGASKIDVLSDLSNLNEFDGDFLMLVSIVGAMICIVWCGILYNKSDWRDRNYDIRKSITARNLYLLFSIGVGGSITTSFLLTMINQMLPKAFTQYNTVMDSLSNKESFVTILYVLLIGPVAEEFIFRGVIFDRLYLVFPMWIANMIQALLFGVYHMNFIQGVYAFIIGMILCAFKQRTGSIVYCISAHILLNATSFILLGLISGIKNEKISMIIILLLVSMFVSGIIRLIRGDGKVNEKTADLKR